MKKLPKLSKALYKASMISIMDKLQELYPEVEQSTLWACVKERMNTQYPEINKGGFHKYIRREGSSGNYKYIYHNAEGKQVETNMQIKHAEGGIPIKREVLLGKQSVVRDGDVFTAKFLELPGNDTYKVKVTKQGDLEAFKFITNEAQAPTEYVDPRMHKVGDVAVVAINSGIDSEKKGKVISVKKDDRGKQVATLKTESGEEITVRTDRLRKPLTEAQKEVIRPEYDKMQEFFKETDAKIAALKEKK